MPTSIPTAVANRTPRRSRSAGARLTGVLLTAAVAAAAVAAAFPAAAQTAGDTVRITARKLTDGRIEFALQQQHDNSWGDRLLPDRRFFPTTATTGRWLNSSPVTLTIPSQPQTPAYTAITAGVDETDDEPAGEPEIEIRATIDHSCQPKPQPLWCQMSEGDWRVVNLAGQVCESGQYLDTYSKDGGECGPHDPNFDPHWYGCGPIVPAYSDSPSDYVYSGDLPSSAYPIMSEYGGCVYTSLDKWWVANGPNVTTRDGLYTLGERCNGRDHILGRDTFVCVPIDTPVDEMEPWQYRAASRSIYDSEAAMEEEFKRPYYHLDLPFVRAWCKAHSTEDYDQNIVQGFCAVLEE